eukprot:jgi/Hompol1/4316/HPOL_007045-RA
MIEGLLKFDPAARLTVEEALAHPYLEAYHDIEDEPVHEEIFDFSFESVEAVDDLRRVPEMHLTNTRTSRDCWFITGLIAEEIRGYKLAQQEASQGLQARMQLPISVQSRDTAEPAPEEPVTGAMDIDEELRMRGH